MAQQTTIINKFGRMTGWNSITANLLGRDLEGYNSLKYDDNVTKENVFGAGKYAIGRTEGNYEANCEIGIYKEEADALMRSLPPGMRIQDIMPFDINVSYERADGSIINDRIRNAEFTNAGVDVKQGDGSIVTVYKMIISHIDWNVI